MTDTPVDVSNVSPPLGEPNLVYQGQLYSRETAAVALAAFDADEAKVKAALGGDLSAQQERRDLWMLARGMQPGALPAMPMDGHGVHEQMTEREEQITEARLDAFAKHTRMTPELRMQFSRRLATQEQHDFAVAERERLLKDPNFRAKVFAGHADETDRWIKIVQAATAPVAPADYDWSKDESK
jgi:hypothetical protein